jgi:CRISPR-associated protein Cas2
MFVILYYDVNQKRCPKMIKKCREYLVWVQNSVFEGNLTEAQLKRLISSLLKIIKEDENDSLIIYTFETKKYVERIVLGKDKKDDINFL